MNRCVAVVLGLALWLAAGGAVAQTGEPVTAPDDSTASAVPDSVREATDDAQGGQKPGIGELGRMAQEGTVPDSLLTDDEEEDEGQQRRYSTAQSTRPTWYTFLYPTLTGSVRANVSEVGVRGSASAPVFGAVGATGTIYTDKGLRTYRQFDRDQEDSTIRGNLEKSFFDKSVGLDVAFTSTSNRDENRPSNLDPIVLELESKDVTATLDGRHELIDGFAHRWAVRGRLEDVKQSNRNVRNDRTLGSTALASIWRRDGDDVAVKTHYGYERSAGERLVRGVVDDATVEVDTLEAEVRVFALPRANLVLEGGRSTFYEQRLDFARNANGVVDTVNVVDAVGREREVRESHEWALSGDVRIVRGVRMTGRRDLDFTETTYRFSRQGIVQRGSESTDVGAVWSYASAGSLQVDYGFSERYSDRRAQGDDQFRGRESTKNYEIDATLRQELFMQSSLLLSASQRLTQNIYRERNNDNDRDRLVEEVASEVRTSALPWTSLTVRGTIRNTSEINIKSTRVGNNKDENLYEVRTTYNFDPPGGFSASQTYRLQIVYRDFIDGIDRDTFNKQGQVTTNVDWSFPGRGRLGVEYLSDYRSTGNRNESEPVREFYVTTSVRRDRRLTARASVPMGPLNLSAAAERGFLDQEQGGRTTEQDSGKLSLRVDGQWKFFRERLAFDIDVERVLQFGPRIRAEQEDYWVANSTVTVTF